MLSSDSKMDCPVLVCDVTTMRGDGRQFQRAAIVDFGYCYLGWVDCMLMKWTGS
jgi:hypothetical protein